MTVEVTTAKMVSMCKGKPALQHKGVMQFLQADGLWVEDIRHIFLALFHVNDPERFTLLRDTAA